MSFAMVRAALSFGALIARGKKAAILPDSTIGLLNAGTHGLPDSIVAFTTGWASFSGGGSMNRPDYLNEDDDFDRVVEEERRKQVSAQSLDMPKRRWRSFPRRIGAFEVSRFQSKRRVDVVRRDHPNTSSLALARMAC